MTPDTAMTAIKLVHAMMDEADILAAGRLLLARMTDDERVRFKCELFNDYCRACGRKYRNEADLCSCQNDE